MFALFNQILTFLEGDLFALSFFVAFVYRVLSGVQNGLFYNKSESGHFIPVFFMLFACLFLGKYGANIWGVRVLCVSWFFIAAMSLKYSFGNIREGWGIHEFETIGMYIFAAGFLFISPLGFALSVYPSIIFHKAAVNIGSGKGFFYEGTNDKMGKTFSFFGWNVPRTNNKIRLSAAVISLIIFFVVWIY